MVDLFNKEQCVSPKKRRLWLTIVLSYKEQCMSPKKRRLCSRLFYRTRNNACPQRKDGYGAWYFCPTKNSVRPEDNGAWLLCPTKNSVRPEDNGAWLLGPTNNTARPEDDGAWLFCPTRNTVCTQIKDMQLIMIIALSSKERCVTPKKRWLWDMTVLFYKCNPRVYCMCFGLWPFNLSFLSTHSSGAVWESRWPSWAVRPNEPSGFRGRKAILNHASALVKLVPNMSTDIWGH